MIMLIMARNKWKNKDNTEVLLVDFAMMRPFYSPAIGLMNVSGSPNVAELLQVAAFLKSRHLIL